VRRRRNRFRAWELVENRRRLPIVPDGPRVPEPEVREVAEWFQRRDPSGAITAEIIRDAIDLVLDGQRTGRWCYGHLTKTEKTYLGTVIQIELQKEFEISDDGPLDYAIAGIPVDCKYAAAFGTWQIPREMYRRQEDEDLPGEDHIALLIWAEERSRRWQAGLIRITDSRLRAGPGNQDRKRTLASEALEEIYWIWNEPVLLPENTILGLDEEDRAAIFSFPRSGQARIDELLRRVQLKTLRRSVILTVAQQDDALKRPRDARERLRPEGILIFGHQSGHIQVARELGIDAQPGIEQLPGKGEFIAARVIAVAPNDPRPKALLEGRCWALARPHEPSTPGPTLPRAASGEA
jgi:hypothetical protein